MLGRTMHNRLKSHQKRFTFHTRAYFSHRRTPSAVTGVVRSSKPCHTESFCARKFVYTTQMRENHSLGINYEPESFTEPQALLNHFSENVDALNPEQTTATLLHLTDLIYKNLQYPWLQPVKSVARLQLILTGRHSNVIQAYSGIESYKVLIDKLMECSGQVSDLSVIRCLDAASLLFEESTCPVTHNLLQECCQRLPNYDIQCLAEFGSTVRHLPKGIFMVTLKPAIKRFQELLPYVERDLSTRSLSHFADAMRNLHLYLSCNLLTKSSLSLLAITQGCADEINDPETINSVSYMARRMYASDSFVHEPMTVRRVPVEIVKYARTAAVRNVDKYDPRHIAEICSSLKQTRQYTREASDAFVTRAMDLLNTDLPLSDVTNLFYSLNAQVPRQTRRMFESVLYPKMTTADSLTLSNLAEAFDQVELDNHDIFLRFQQLVIENSEALCQASSRLFFVLKYLLSRMPSVEDSVQKHLLKTLTSQMKDQHLITSFLTPTIANFCLQCNSGKIPDFLFNEVLKSIAQWRINSLKKVLIDLSENKRIHQPQLQMLITEIQHQIYQQVVDKPHVIDNVRQLTSFVHLMALHAYYRDQVLTDKLMRLYLKFTDDLNPTTMAQVVKIFTILKYHLPDVLDELIKVLMAGNFPLDIWVQTLGACSIVGYTPRDLNMFAAALFQKLNIVGECEDVTAEDSAKGAQPVLLQELRVMHWLSTLQFYPEDRLGQIFSLEFIEKVDDFFAVHPEHQREVEDTMMRLNRNVFLECPQLDVPWFHESYCQKHLGPDEHASNYKHEMLKENIYHCLHDALGGPQYIEKAATTPYYYTVDFECVLDQAGRAMDYNVIDDKRHPDLQRVAILPFTESDFCYNSKRLINSQKTKLRHLQILGYKVIQIPTFTWYSMGLAEHDNKVDFLKDRIFGPS